MSYLQFDLTALNNLTDLTFRAQLPDEDRAAGGLLRLWERCWREKRAEVHLADIATAFRVREPHGVNALVDALERYEFIIASPNGTFIVRGALKRLGLLRKRQKAAGATNAGKGEQKPAEPPNALISPATALPGPVETSPPAAPALPEQKPTNTGALRPAGDLVKRLVSAFQSTPPAPEEAPHAEQDQEEPEGSPPIEHRDKAPTDTPPAAPVAEESRAEAAAGEGAGVPATEGKHPNPVFTLNRKLCEAYRKTRRCEYGWSQRDWGAAKRLRAMAVGDDDEVVRRWVRALNTPGYYGCQAVYELEAKWNYHAPKVDASDGTKDADPLRAEIATWVGLEDGSLNELVRQVRGAEPRLVPGWLRAIGFDDAVVASAQVWADKQQQAVAS